MRRASPLLTSMPGTRVLDARVHIGCHHLLASKVNQQLTLAGIEGETLLADPETRHLPCDYACASEVADRWRHPRYLTRRGNLHCQKCPILWLPPIPATPLQYGGVRWSLRCSPCDDLSPQDRVSLSADDNGRLTPGPSQAHLSSLTSWESHRDVPVFSRACFRSRCPATGRHGRGQAGDVGSFDAR
jgi:hypothetical protein